MGGYVHHKSQGNLDKHNKPIHHFDPLRGSTALGALEEFQEMGVFAGGAIGKAFSIYKKMLNEKTRVFFSLAGAMVPGGMRKTIVEAIKHGLVDVLITTGANITHDLIEAFGVPHIRDVSYSSDKELYEKGIDRVYDAFVNTGGFESLEEHIQPMIQEFISKKREGNHSPVITSSHEFLQYLGSRIKDPHSIVRVAHDYGVPIFVPVLADSVLGLQIWLNAQLGELVLDEMRDLSAIQELFHNAEKAGAVMIGGGVPKNYTLQASLMSPKQFLFGIQVTMDRVESGGLSGATLEEAISWGKFTAEAPKVQVFSDATIVLPILVSGLIQWKAKQQNQ